MVDASATSSSEWQFWNSQLEMSCKVKGYKSWVKRGKQIVRRYRDQRVDSADYSDSQNENVSDQTKFNILWSNVQTLKPAVYAKPPKPVAERRYLDMDDVGRTASVILERSLSYMIEDGDYFHATSMAVLDRLLPGRGQIWVRYEPTFRALPQKTQETDTEEAKDPGTAQSAAEEPQEEVASEITAVDYVDWEDFFTSASRTWKEVWWVAKRVYMDRKELVKRFGKEKGNAITLDWSPAESQILTPGVQPGDLDSFKKATVYEIWNKRDREVVWIAKEWSNDLLDKKPDPLKLEGFYPCPRPCMSTTTNDSLVPVADYYEYQDQAAELDDLTNRITNVTRAIKVAGTYNSEYPELQRIFEEGKENELIGVAEWNAFKQGAGSDGMGHLWLLPLKDMVETLIQLQQARAQVKNDLYEITGISDIVRGQATSGAATATEQRIKGQFASMRLNDMQFEVQRFCRDTLRIMGEIIAEHFSDETLFLMSGFAEYAKEQWPAESFAPPPQPPAPQMGHNGGPPMQATPGGPPSAGAGAPGGGAPPAAGMLPGLMGAQQPIVLPPEAQAQQKAQEMFQKAVALLRHDKLRGFRIDIETDSMIEPDQQQMQQARSELLGAISQFLPQAVEATTANPTMGPLMGRLLMFFLRGFRASRDIESAFEQFIEAQEKQAKNPQPKPPSPEEIKAQAEIQKQKMETERSQMDMANEQQRMQMEMEMLQQKNDMELQMMQAKIEFEEKKLQLQERKLLLDAQAAQQKHALDIESQQQQAAVDAESMERQASFDERQAERDEERASADHERGIEADETKHEMGLQMMAEKAKQAKAKPNGSKTA